MKKLRFNLTCLYKNTKVSHNVFIEQVSMMVKKLCLNSEENVVIGNLNIYMSTGENAFDSHICDVYGLKNLIRSSTYLKGYEGSLIDGRLSDSFKYFKISGTL